MPSKQYRIWLSDNAYMVVDFTMVRGRIVSFVVRLMHVDEAGAESNVARYDTAHGAPHRDILGRKAGVLTKTWYIDASLDSVLRQAIGDFKHNYEDYYRTHVEN